MPKMRDGLRVLGGRRGFVNEEVDVAAELADDSGLEWVLVEPEAEEWVW